MARTISSHINYRPETLDGHLYYARLKTDMGVFYKLGFTKGRSVAERLAFQGNGDEDLIDDVLLFTYRLQAYDDEQRLHNHFKEKRMFGPYGGFNNAPLFENGQSELYAEDILGLDEQYTTNQRDRTRALVSGTSVSKIVWQDRFVTIVGWLLAAPLIPVVRLCQFLFDRFEDKTTVRARDEAKRKRSVKRADFETQELLDDLKAITPSREWVHALREAANRRTQR